MCVDRYRLVVLTVRRGRVPHLYAGVTEPRQHYNLALRRQCRPSTLHYRTPVLMTSRLDFSYFIITPILSTRLGDCSASSPATSVLQTSSRGNSEKVGRWMSAKGRVRFGERACYFAVTGVRECHPRKFFVNIAANLCSMVHFG